jgi:nicotinamidase-related amidase
MKSAEEKPALLVIDVQEGTTGTTSTIEAFTSQADSLINRINKTTSEYNEAGIPVIFITQQVSNPLVNFLNNSMAKGSEGTQIDRRLNHKGEVHFFKNKADAFHNNEFDKFLRESGINTLYLTGLDAAQCVKSTALGALNRAYNVILIEDLIISQTEKEKSEALQFLKEKGAVIIRP